VIVKHAKDIVRQWVTAEAGAIPGFRGAFYHGSAVWLPDNSPLQSTSDIDVMVVVDDPDPPLKLGKFVYRNVLFDVTWLPWDQVHPVERVLGDHSLAGSLRSPEIITDPTGKLGRIQQIVAGEFARRRWVNKRCESVRGRLLNALRSVKEERPFHDQVTSWLFGTGLTTHVLLVAGLRNPTVRKRYLAARDLLAGYGYPPFYETLLEQLGCASMSPERAGRHLDALAEAFDVATEVIGTPVFFASDISKAARPIAIDGSRELIANGDHREAIFWIVATWARCQNVFHLDAPEMETRFEPGFRELLADVGIVSFADLKLRGDQVEASLSRLWEVAEAIIAANPEVTNDP